MTAPSIRPVLYVDTCAVIEAIRAGCWNAIIQRFDVRTVTEVRNETQRGNPASEDYVPVELGHFNQFVTTESVASDAIASITAKVSSVAAIHKGEAELLALLFPRKREIFYLCTADRAAVRAACKLGLEQKLTSLEEVAQKCGSSPKLEKKGTKKWLQEVRTQFHLDQTE